MRLSLGLVASLFLVACTNNVGPGGLAVGGPCMDWFDCVTGSFCVQGRAFPDGMCTVNCEAPEDCRAGSQCLDAEGGVCAVTCVDDDDCRDAYACSERPIRGGTTANLCVGR